MQLGGRLAIMPPPLEFGKPFRPPLRGFRIQRLGDAGWPARVADAEHVELPDHGLMVISTRSPTRTSFEGLTVAPPIRTRPFSTASAASERVLKKRAAHSHLSMRSLAPGSVEIR